ncbi:hypothetical protein LPUS_10384 [Lasallia pustulata]|uniref:Uncharacterized protein n=1 Tax=Lasallia pustulata TaxID=136370 RepID=A0A1W5D9Q7_9LECA|nr:hypothetical protein LPUS_10384 [Lasallia pustulata]
MSYYDAPSWQSPGRQAASWEQPLPPSRSGANSAMQREELSAFGTQLEEVDRALDNLVNSGKLFNPSSRRDSVPIMGGQRPYADYDPRIGGPPSRQHSVNEFDPLRSHSASNLQNFYANQRYQPRPSEAEQVMQAKRRMAAQRERELRNYHQEQQYNRKISTQGKSERAISPSAMNEEERRELIARQHRALYGNDGPTYYGSDNESQTPRPIGQSSGGPTSSATGRGPSPLAYDAFGINPNQMQGGPSESNGQYANNEQGQQQNSTKGASPKSTQQRSRANSTSSPSSNNQSFSLFESTAQQSSRTSTSSPGGSPPRQAKASNGAIGTGVAPIGTRPAQSQAANPALNKRSTTPLPSPLSYGFAPNENANPNTTLNANERSTSAASNPQSGAKDAGMSMAWGSSSGVWGKTPLGVQASVWG